MLHIKQYQGIRNRLTRGCRSNVRPERLKPRLTEFACMQLGALIIIDPTPRHFRAMQTRSGLIHSQTVIPLCKH